MNGPEVRTSICAVLHPPYHSHSLHTDDIKDEESGCKEIHAFPRHYLLSHLTLSKMCTARMTELGGRETALPTSAVGEQCMRMYHAPQMGEQAGYLLTKRPRNWSQPAFFDGQIL